MSDFFSGSDFEAGRMIERQTVLAEVQRRIAGMREALEIIKTPWPEATGLIMALQSLEEWLEMREE
jgi:hypothetical protein